MIQNIESIYIELLPDIYLILYNKFPTYCEDKNRIYLV